MIPYIVPLKHKNVLNVIDPAGQQCTENGFNTVSYKHKLYILKNQMAAVGTDAVWVSEGRKVNEV